MAKIFTTHTKAVFELQKTVQKLRAEGHGVYDFRRPMYLDGNIAWVENDNKKEIVDITKCPAKTEIKNQLYEVNLKAMQQADCCIMIFPYDDNALIEAGYMKGLGKRVFVLAPLHGTKNIQMLQMFDGSFQDIEEIAVAIKSCQPL